jgi:hypothetical protein
LLLVAEELVVAPKLKPFRGVFGSEFAAAKLKPVPLVELLGKLNPVVAAAPPNENPVGLLAPSAITPAPDISPNPKTTRR